VTDKRKIRVAVVFGGRSTEHAVSCLSAGNILGAIDRDRYEVIPVGIAADGRWVLAKDAPGRLAVQGGELPSVEAVAEPGTEIAARLDRGQSGLVVTGATQIPGGLGDVDVVLPLLHGPYGEDGTLQGLLEMTGTRYAGAGVLASAAGMDKEYMKLIFAARGLPIGPYVVIRDRDWRVAARGAATAPQAATERKRVLDEVGELGWPVFVKPARGGSSIGTSRARDDAELEEAIENARQHDPKILVEAAVEGMEIECAVLEGTGGGPPDASLPAQVLVGGGADYYDFQAKYLESDTSVAIPPPIPAAHVEQIRQLACAAFDAVSCEGLARVDFFYTPAGQIVVNEINTMPGMTPASAFPRMWEASGLPLPQLVDRIIQTALNKGRGLRLHTETSGTPLWVPLVCCRQSLLLLGGRLGRSLLGAVDGGLEVGAGAELGHRGGRHLDARTGGRVTGRARWALGLLEDTEAGDGDLVALGDGGLDGVEHGVDRLGRRLLVPHPA
jgi:D-alanine--D-alanine ligase